MPSAAELTRLRPVIPVGGMRLVLFASLAVCGVYGDMFNDTFNNTDDFLSSTETMMSSTSDISDSLSTTSTSTATATATATLISPSTSTLSDVSSTSRLITSTLTSTSASISSTSSTSTTSTTSATSEVSSTSSTSATSATSSTSDAIFPSTSALTDSELNSTEFLDDFDFNISSTSSSLTSSSAPSDSSDSSVSSTVAEIAAETSSASSASSSTSSSDLDTTIDDVLFDGNGTMEPTQGITGKSEDAFDLLEAFDLSDWKLGAFIGIVLGLVCIYIIGSYVYCKNVMQCCGGSSSYNKVGFSSKSKKNKKSSYDRDNEMGRFNNERPTRGGPAYAYGSGDNGLRDGAGSDDGSTRGFSDGGYSMQSGIKKRQSNTNSSMPGMSSTKHDDISVPSNVNQKDIQAAFDDL